MIVGPLLDARFSLPPNYLIGLDGTTYELSISAMYVEIRISWWEDLPACWVSAGPSVAKLRELTNRARNTAMTNRSAAPTVCNARSRIAAESEARGVPKCRRRTKNQPPARQPA